MLLGYRRSEERMSLLYVRLGVAAFALLAAGVAVNMLNQPPAGPRLARVVASQPVDAQARVVPVERAVAPPKAGRDGRAGEPETTTGSDTIRAVQRELAARGYEPGTQDGLAGLVTRAAVLAFEEDHKLPLTAEPSENVLKSILLGGASNFPATAAIERAAPGVETVVRAVQQHLTSLGYQTRRTDGRLNPDTLRAIREFETDQGLAMTGRITGPLMARLMKAVAARRPVR
jgi:peptidoglycan hydrolase-like protein with peptidoglycan-binding domain